MSRSIEEIVEIAGNLRSKYISKIAHKHHVVQGPNTVFLPKDDYDLIKKSCEGLVDHSLGTVLTFLGMRVIVITGDKISVSYIYDMVEEACNDGM